MALNAESAQAEDYEPSRAQATQWQRLFGFTYAEAAASLAAFMTNIHRNRVSNEHWAMVQDEKEPQGYDREAYEFGLSRPESLQKEPVSNDKRAKNSTYLIKLDGPFDTPIKVQEAASLSKVPDCKNGTDDDGILSKFCVIDGNAKSAILAHLSAQLSSFQPIFVRVSKAAKNLSSDSPYPTLSLDTTLPQHRPRANVCSTIFLPAQDQYPVWYFFYGTLAEPERLTRLLQREGERRDLRPAAIRGGALKIWAGKYKALVDDVDSEVKGHAYEVTSKEDEEALMVYETENYEVVRCKIAIDGDMEEVRGCTFRYVGDPRALQ